jgi:DNA polymerase-1
MYSQIRAFSYHRFNDPTKRIIRTSDELFDVLRYVEKFDNLAYDTETSGLAWYQHSRICGYSFAVFNPERIGQTLAWYVPFRHHDVTQQIPEADAVRGMKIILENEKQTKICHNLKFERHMALNERVTIKGSVRDTAIEAGLFNEHEPMQLKRRAKVELNDPRPEQHEQILDGMIRLLAKENKLGIDAYRDRYGYAQVPIDISGIYACYDVDATLQLAAFYDRMNVRQFFHQIYSTELELTSVLCEMERNGLPIDVKYLEHVRDLTESSLESTEQRIFQKLGYRFKISSDDQLRQVLLTKLKVPLFKMTTKGNQFSVDKEVLEHFSPEFPVLEDILEYRQAQKISSTYTDSILERLDHRNVLHGDLKSMGTKTGRLSSEKPNLQNFAGDSDKRALAHSGKKVEDGGVDPWSIKRAFVNRSPDMCRLYFDYSQIELRVLAELSCDPTMIDVYVHDQDIHERTSLEVFGNKEKSTRRQAKVINFGLSYCLSATGFSRQSKIPLEDAERHMENFFIKYPRISPYRNEFWAECRRNNNSFINVFGRPRRIPNLASPEKGFRKAAERQSIGSCIQGTAAELTKISLCRLHRWNKSTGAGIKLCSTIHDEISMDVSAKDKIEIARHVKALMEDFSFWFRRVPIKTECEYSTTNWAEKIKLKEVH